MSRSPGALSQLIPRAGARLPTPDRGALYWLLAATLLAALPLLAHLPLWISLLFLVLLGARLLCAWRGWHPPARALLLLAGPAAMIGVFLQFHALWGRDAGFSLLLVLVGLKLFELRAMRDYMLAASLLFLLFLGGVSFGQSLWLLAYLAGGVLLAVAVLFRLTLPRAGTARSRLRFAAGLLLRALPLMLILFALFPRLQGSVWSAPGGAGATSGLSERLRMGSISDLSLSDAIAFRVQFDGPPPPPSQRYWRALVHWQTDGTNWTRGDLRAGTAAFRPLGQPVNYTLALEPTSQAWLVALDLPALLPEEAHLLPGFVLEARRPITHTRRYSLVSYPRYRVERLSGEEHAWGLQLPATGNARTRGLAQRWREQAASPAALVEIALRHFREQPFVYTLSPPRLGGDPVDAFLFDTRRGFCEHYAAAFATLMRAAGVPTRIVIGYQGGEHNVAGGYFTVRQADAHAWNEVWLEGRGWVRVDPTAAVAPERIEHGSASIRRLEARGAVPGRLTDQALLRAIAPTWAEQAWMRTRHAWDAANTVWFQWVLNYGYERQQRLLAALGFAAPAWSTLAALLAASFAMVLLIIAAFMFVPRGARDPLERAYDRVCRRLARVGFVRAPHETPLQFAQRVARRRPDLAQSVRALTQAYVALRYGPPGDHALRRQFLRRARRFHAARA